MEGFYGYTYGKMRFWEVLPGVLTWGTFAAAVILSIWFPIAAIIFIIVFDVYWVARVGYFVVVLSASYQRYRRALTTDWSTMWQGIERAQSVRHMIFLPTYKEDIGIIRSTLASLAAQSYPAKRMIIVLAGEERDAERFQKCASILTREFGETFMRMYVTEHPAGLPDEIPGKGSNLHWSAQQVAKRLAQDEPTLRDEDVVVSSFDVDTIAHPHYFSYLTYLYATVKDPTRVSYQPVALFSNTIWDAPAPVRVAAFGTTFWLLGELARPERLWTFSSHSMPWKMLRDVGFWQKDIVSEDSRIFLQAFVHYNGAYRVEPMYLPVSMDTVAGEGYIDALKALYEQQRRWAWGVEHLPAMIAAFRAHPQIPRAARFRALFNHIEGMFTWATAPMLIFILGYVPLLMVSQPDALVQAAPYTLQALMRLATVGVFVSALLSLFLLPPRPAKKHPWQGIVMIAQWLLLPVTFVLFGAFPAIDAQTRFMFGRYLGFNVSKKKR